MKKIIKLSVILLLIIAYTNVSGQTTTVPKNIIILISDGCGYNHISATNYYTEGKDSVQVYEKFPVNIGMSTYYDIPEFDEKTGEKLDGYNTQKAWSDSKYLKKYYTGSAAAATAMATGQKTYLKKVGVDRNNNNLENVLEKATKLGKSTGVVTSVPFCHATPAGFATHNKHRGNYTQIGLSMILDTKLNVIMGCGNPYYNNKGKKVADKKASFKYIDSKQTWLDIINNKDTFVVASISGNNIVQDIDNDNKPDPWHFIETREDFQKLANTENPPKRVLGIAQANSTLQQSRYFKLTKQKPEKNEFNQNVPTLVEMAESAINVLEQDEDGFILMIEGGAIDWASHENNLAKLIEEEMDFNKTVEAVVKWVEANGGWEENLVIVTADHECGYLTGPKFKKHTSPETYKVVNQGKGKLPKHKFNHRNHTNQLVPFFAKGSGSELFLNYANKTDKVRGKYIDNTDIMKVFLQIWN